MANADYRGTYIHYFTAGGAVRDLLLGRCPKDADYVFATTEEVFLQRNPTARKTKSGTHPIYMLNGQEYTPLAGSCEAPPSAANNGTKSLPPYTKAAPNTTTTSAEAAALKDAITNNIAKRDFTINAMLLSDSGVLHSHPHSLEDLKNKILRPASPTALQDDPVRLYRAARFLAELPGFSLHPETCAQIHALKDCSLQNITAEQVGKECLKALASPQPGIFLQTLSRTKKLMYWFKELESSDTIPAGPQPYHSESVLEHTADVMNATAVYASRYPQARAPLAVWMALCHDLGKALTLPELLPRHIGHEESGIGPAKDIAQRLRLPRIYCEAGILAAQLHMLAGNYASLRPGTKVDLLMRANARGLVLELFLVAAADSKHTGNIAAALNDLAIILATPLPRHLHGLGPESGRRLRDLRAQALAASNCAILPTRTPS